MIERNNVQVYIFTRNPDLQILLLKRTPERSGYWQPVCGGVEENESNLLTAKREVHEEVGLRYDGIIIDIGYQFSYQEPKNGVLMTMQDTCYAIEVTEKFKVQISEEHNEYKWCSVEEALQLVSWSHIHTAIHKLQNLIE